MKISGAIFKTVSDHIRIQINVCLAYLMHDEIISYTYVRHASSREKAGFRYGNCVNS